MKPADMPIGFVLAQTAKAVSRAFDDALSQAGGSLPLWLVLLSLMRAGPLSHAQLAEHVGIKGPTLTHHLDRLEERGLITRERLAENRRTQVAQLTPKGEALFHRLRKAAQTYDARLRRNLSEKELADLRRLLQKLTTNAHASTSSP